MADRLLLNCGITCWRQLCFWCWNCLKLVGGVMRRLEWRVLNVHMTERALFCFPYWRENILAIITIILEVVCSRIIWLSIGVILGKSWGVFVAAGMAWSCCFLRRNWDISSEVEACVGCLRKYCFTACNEAPFFRASHYLVLKVLPRARKVADSSIIMI